MSNATDASAPTLTITRRTARNVCYTWNTGRQAGMKCSMLHAKFDAWIAQCPSYTVNDLTN